jgi:SNF2 family DNA or RNA helicase
MTTPELLPLWSDFAYKCHQVTGVAWMLQRESATPAGGLLCDEMGLGKTIEVLGCVINNAVRFTLLLCPKAVISQWVEAATKSSINVFTLIKDKKVSRWRMTEEYKENRPFLYITNYEKLTTKNAPLFQRRTWNRLVMDEAHKSTSNNNARQISTIRRNITWCVTATPIINRLRDIQTLLTHVGYERDDVRQYNKLKEAIQEASLMRSMSDMRGVLPELPSAPLVRKEVLDFDTEEEGEFYCGIQGMTVRAWRAAEQDNVKSRLALLMRLRQISVHPQVYINSQKKIHPGIYNRADWTEASTKFNFLKAKIESGTVGAKWIVFCQFHDEMNMLRDFLASSPAIRNIYSYHGKLTHEEKDETLKATHQALPADGRSDVLLLQLQSGGVGLNLQHFSRIVFMSPWWTNAMMEQAIGRAVRIGQKESVDVTILSLKGEGCLNIDENMLKKGFEKRGIMERLYKVPVKGGLMPIVALDYEAELDMPSADEPSNVVATQDPMNHEDE